MQVTVLVPTYFVSGHLLPIYAGKYKMALKDYEGVYRARPNDKDAKLKYTECKKIVQQMAFQKGTSLMTK